MHTLVADLLKHGSQTREGKEQKPAGGGEGKLKWQEGIAGGVNDGE